MVVYSFFFSSRRRHTRYWRDWSSDVCSSDLAHELDQADAAGRRAGLDAGGVDGLGGLGHRRLEAEALVDVGDVVVDGLGDADRSEERRVGKECRSRWSPYH